MDLINKVVTKIELKKIAIKENEELVNSMNSLHKSILATPKLLIIGTITPPKGNGYYYTAPRNRIYGYIDQALNTNIKQLKNKLNNESLSISEQKKIIKKIKCQLCDNSIAFIDVIDQAIRDKKSSEDRLISHCTLDYNSFMKIKSANYIVCNSKDAMDCYLEISKIYQIPCTSCKFLSQRCGLKKDWIETIKKACRN